jgi:hypothetical protein
VLNSGDDVISDWAIEVVFPQAMLEPNNNYPIVRSEDDGMVVMRQTEAAHSGPLFPGDEKELIGIDYFMDDKLYHRRGGLFNRDVDPCQRQLARQHQSRRTSAADHHRVFGHRNSWFRMSAKFELAWGPCRKPWGA